MKIIVMSSHTPSLFWFRMEMMRAFINKGAQVVAIGPEREEDWANRFENTGIRYRYVPVIRNGLNICADIKTYRAIKHIIKEEKPDKIFTYNAKTIVYGALAAKSVSNIQVYSLVAGLGSIFRGKGLKNHIVRTILSVQYKIAFKLSKKVIFQNTDDQNEMIKRHLVTKNKVCIINGSGVNVEKFSVVPMPSKPAILFIGRLIGDKGVREYLELAKRLKEHNQGVKCLLVGPFDSNPTAITKQELQPYIDDNVVEYFGEQTDVRPYLEQCSIYVLPSYHEGTPKTVLEAMAMGRPVVTTDAPGCRETVVDGVNGYLVPVKNVDALENAVVKIIQNKDLAYSFSKESRRIAVEKYDVKKVNSDILKIMEL